MIALSVRQPWAELFMRGEKEPYNHPEYGYVNIEYRSCATNIRGQIYIYASLGRYNRKDEENLTEKYNLDMNSLPRGVIIGMIELAGCDYGDWYMKNPGLLSEPRKPARRANSVWFYPFDEDVPKGRNAK
ncbi:MAG: hypothetical protein KAI50_00410 [Desulfobacterales bacterium]|nr:hypothetical protein [Desulfobacterales bacterium]